MTEVVTEIVNVRIGIEFEVDIVRIGIEVGIVEIDIVRTGTCLKNGSLSDRNN